MIVFDLSGPEFLWFYLVLGGLSYAFLRVYVTQRERQHPIPKLKLSDPFQIAFLRGDKNETIRIASLSLIDRGLLKIVNPSDPIPKLETTRARDIDLGNTWIERALLNLFRIPQAANAAFNNDECKKACVGYSLQLGEHRLVRTAEIIQERLVPVGLIAVLLLGVALIKIYVALDRDRTNIAFLVALVILLMYLFARLIWRNRTGLGDLVVADLKTLFHSLYIRRDSLRPGRQTAEAALLAAVFGLFALPAAFQYARAIFRKASKSGSSCGSSCGSAGCGGGCGSGGGCGGCGS